jgi:peptidoglycan/xylan/chitin deacetylase (PgdA/CDA1 family)
MGSTPSHKHRLRVKSLERIRVKRSVVLGYHGVAELRLRDDLSLLQVSPPRFRSQIEGLLEAGFRFLTMAEMARRAEGGMPEPGLAAITFDDGMRNNHSVALPILREYDIPATVYVTIGFIDGVSPWIGPGGDGAIMSAEELRDLLAAGWELGAHTMTHPDLCTLDYETCRHEIEESRDRLQLITGANVETFAYPFGRYNQTAVTAVKDSGLRAAVTTGSGSWAPYEITRAMIGAADPFPVMLLKLTDRYEPMLRIPPLRIARRASKRARELIRERGNS